MSRSRDMSIAVVLVVAVLERHIATWRSTHSLQTTPYQCLPRLSRER